MLGVLTTAAITLITTSVALGATGHVMGARIAAALFLMVYTLILIDVDALKD